MTSPKNTIPINQQQDDVADAILSSSSNSTSSFLTSLENENRPQPTRSLSATTLTMGAPPSGGGSQVKRHSVRSNSQVSSTSLDRSISQPPQSPINPTSIHKSLTALDAKSITRDMEKSVLQQRADEVISSPLSPTNNMSFQSLALPTGPPQSQYHRQNSASSISLPPSVYHNSAQGDAWQTLCVRVLPLFNGEGVQGAIEDLNDLLR